MIVLGISAYFHDSACAIIIDGEVKFASQEERYTRKKFESGFPIQAIGAGLKQLSLDINQVDEIVFFDKPLLKFNRILEAYITNFPRGFKSFSMSIPIWLHQKIFTESNIKKSLAKNLGYQSNKSIKFCSHHLSHAASAYYPSPFDEATVVTADSIGEWATTTIGKGHGNKLYLLKEQQYPHSLGLLYSTFTQFLGFKIYSGESKLMGLASYGKPIFKKKIYDHLLSVEKDFSFTLNKDYFYFDIGNVMFSSRFEKLFDGIKRNSNQKIEQKHRDLAASIQEVLEEVMVGICCYAYEQMGMKNLVLAGGIALNCVCNRKILEKTPFENVWVQPAAGDAGGALGAALHFYYYNNERKPLPSFHALLGDEFSKADIEQEIKSLGLTYRKCEEEELYCLIASKLDQGEIIGWFQGRMEFGPRALGNRSILADPRNTNHKDMINKRIKFREDFRPFAPVVIENESRNYFVEENTSPFMLFTYKVKNNMLPAITHVDMTARVQTVNANQNNKLYQLLLAFKKIAGIPVLLNTSFNLNNEPIVRTPRQAIDSFFRSELDSLVLDNFIIEKRKEGIDVFEK